MMKMNFKSDNPLTKIELTLADLCCIGGISGPKEIRPDHLPILTDVENVVERNAKTNATKNVTKYGLVFPGSGFMRVVMKVEEEHPSITQDVIDKHGGMVRVSIEGYSYGSFETENGGARPYFKAERIVPVQAQAQPSK